MNILANVYKCGFHCLLYGSFKKENSHITANFVSCVLYSDCCSCCINSVYIFSNGPSSRS